MFAKFVCGVVLSDHAGQNGRQKASLSRNVSSCNMSPLHIIYFPVLRAWIKLEEKVASPNSCCCCVSLNKLVSNGNYKRFYQRVLQCFDFYYRPVGVSLLKKNRLKSSRVNYWIFFPHTSRRKHRGKVSGVWLYWALRSAIWRQIRMLHYGCYFEPSQSSAVRGAARHD